MHKTGIVDLPLHSGKAPSWLFKRMLNLSKQIFDVLIYEYSQKEVLKRLSDPYWFQALGCVLGFDWQSSGLTTTTCAAIKYSIPIQSGIKVAGGKGKYSKNTLQEISSSSEFFNLNEAKIKKLQYASRMSARVDNNCVQDGYSLYHHTFIFTEKGEWIVIQQGMNDQYARRYHWSSSLTSFIEEPHQSIFGNRKEDNVLNLTSEENKEIRKASVDLVKDNPIHLKKYFSFQSNLLEFQNFEKTTFPKRHEIISSDISKKGWQSLQKAYELQVKDYEELVALEGIGQKTLKSLALISELIYGNEISWKDSAKFAYCVGGKDKIPFEIDKSHYDDVILNLKEAIELAKLGKTEKIKAIKRLVKILS
ncbi:MAG: DUF763 domain-containing protein [Candidatus Aenigmatarchaeota archaeon]|nr:DUF763 domain-containing protein [Candidatus Aenigmarchaeota archaeon]